MAQDEKSGLMLAALVVGGGVILLLLLTGSRRGDASRAGLGGFAMPELGLGGLGDMDFSIPESNLSTSARCCDPCAGKVMGAAPPQVPPRVTVDWGPPPAMAAIMEFTAPAFDDYRSPAPASDSCGWNAGGYLASNPDVANAYKEFRGGSKDWKKWAKKWGVSAGAVSKEQFARLHYEQWGMLEGRDWACTLH